MGEVYHVGATVSSPGLFKSSWQQMDNLETIFARYNRLKADNVGCFQDYDLSDYEAAETISRTRRWRARRSWGGSDSVRLVQIWRVMAVF